ncbi:MAG TPA: nucleotidyltransferase family protein [Candidatus Bathyarchaeia archaeon]|nr:nucleotidyltransferase family protein [Candidatus Bathyarchaeia archaeon]
MSHVSTAVIMAGGRGTRLLPVTESTPKALVSIQSRPLLEWIIRWLARNGVSNIVIGVAFEKEKIIDRFKDGEQLGVQIKYSNHSVEGGTAEGFRLAIERHVSDDVFLAMNGDELTDIKLDSLIKIHLQSGALATVSISALRSPFGVVRLDSEDHITGFDEKISIPGVFVSMGVYVFRRQILQYIPPKGDIERTTFPTLSRMGKLQAYRHNGFWATVNNLKELQQAEETIQHIFPFEANSLNPHHT